MDFLEKILGLKKTLVHTGDEVAAAFSAAETLAPEHAAVFRAIKNTLPGVAWCQSGISTLASETATTSSGQATDVGEKGSA